MAESLPQNTGITDTSNGAESNFRIFNTVADDDFGFYYNAQEWQADVCIETTLRELFIPALCSRQGVNVVVNSQCAVEFNAILTEFMTTALDYSKCCCGNDHLLHISRPFFSNGTVYYSRYINYYPTLANYISWYGPWTFAQVEQWLRPVCEAVAMLHENGISHYAISPNNIGIIKDKWKDERAVLMDFGRAIYDSTRAYLTLTPYLPKEQYMIVWLNSFLGLG